MKIALRFFTVVILILLFAACDQSAPGVPTPTIAPIVTIKTRNSEIRNPEVVPYTVENCNGQSLVETNPSRSRSTTVEINLTLGGSVEFEAPVKAKLEAEFSVSSGETVGSDQNFTLRADAGRRITYEVTWSETWQVGEADINGITIPYEIRTGLKADVGSGTPESCPATQTLQAVSATTATLAANTPIPPTSTDALSPTPLLPTTTPTIAPTLTNPPNPTDVLPTSTATSMLTSSQTAPPVQIVTSFAAPGTLPNGIACSANGLLLADNATSLFDVDLSGKLIAVYQSPDPTPMGLGSDGLHFWVQTTARNLIYPFQISASQLVVGSPFASPGKTTGGSTNDMAWDGSNLWYADNYNLHELDTAGNKLKSLPFAETVSGVDWDGMYLWVAHNASQSLSVIDRQGNLVQSFPSPVPDLQGLVWCGSELWAIGRTGVGSSYQVYQLAVAGWSVVTAINTAVPPTPAVPSSPLPPSATPVNGQLHVFATRESLTLYVSEATSLNGFQFGLIVDGKLKLNTLADSFDALTLSGGQANTNDCYVYQADGTAPPLSQSCKGQVYRNTVAAADVFWYDTVTNQPRDLAIFHEGQTTGIICSAAESDCKVNWVPSAISNATSEPTVSPISQIQASPIITVKDYPCPAEIIFNANIPLNVVHVRPVGSSSLAHAVQQGAKVIITAREQETTDVFWYHITDMNSTEIGWIQPLYLVPSDSCPVLK